MSLIARITALAQAVGADIKSVKAQISAAATALAANVRGTVLTGLVTTTATAVLATDTVLAAFGKIQGRLNALGTASNANLTTSTTDTTVGNVLKVGDLGVTGEVILLAAGVSWDTVTTPGLYFIPSATGTNVPLSGGNFFLQVVKSGTSTKQIATLFGSATAFERPQASGTWLAWDKRVTLSNILGTVSQASGVPTGAIIESGTINGAKYTKWADGTMMCRLPATNAAPAASSAFGSVFGGAQIGFNFPVAFSSVPDVTWSGVALTVTTGWPSNEGGPSTTGTGNIRWMSPVSGATGNVGYTAWGRWYE